MSFREREGQFALLRAVGLSMNQLTLLIWIEQALVVAAGLALGTWMGGQVGATIMTFLGHDDTGGRVLPPYTLDVDWVTLISTYAAIIAVFTVIIAVRGDSGASALAAAGAEIRRGVTARFGASLRAAAALGMALWLAALRGRGLRRPLGRSRRRW